MKKKFISKQEKRVMNAIRHKEISIDYAFEGDDFVWRLMLDDDYGNFIKEISGKSIRQLINKIDKYFIKDCKKAADSRGAIKRYCNLNY